MDDYSGIPAKLEHNLLLAGAALDLPANGSAAGEADQLDAIVGHEQSGVFIRQWKHVECAIRKAGLLHGFREKKSGERSLRRGLQNDGTAAGYGRRDLVSN